MTSADELMRIQNTLKPGDAVVFQIMRAGRGRDAQTQEWGPLFASGNLPANGK